jgi:hypothetical protein
VFNPGSVTLGGIGAGAKIGPAESLLTAVGYQAFGSAIRSNIESTAFGYHAGGNAIDPDTNNLFGINALGSCTYGCRHNVAFGTDAMRNAQNAFGNTAIGSSALINNNGSSNVAIGDGNVMAGTIGIQTTGNFNTAVGAQSMSAAGYTTGSNNTMLGALSAAALTTGGSNVVIGMQAGLHMTTDNSNVIIGKGAGLAQAGGSNNVLIGLAAGSTQVAVNNNVAIGINAGSKLTGGNNTYIGTSVGSSAGTSGGFNILLGVAAGADTPATNTANYFGVFGNSSTPSISIAGTNTPATATTTIHGSTFVLPDIASSTAAQTGSLCWAAGGLTYDPTNTCLVSSRKFKDNITSLSDSSGMLEIMKLRPVSYTYKDKKLNGNGQSVGLIAEEVNDVDKRLVGYDDKGEPHSVKYENLTAILIKGLQEQQHEIDDLKKIKYQRDGQRCYVFFWCGN